MTSKVYQASYVKANLKNTKNKQLEVAETNWKLIVFVLIISYCFYSSNNSHKNKKEQTTKMSINKK